MNFTHKLEDIFFNFLLICGDGPLEKIVKIAVDEDHRIKYMGKVNKKELENLAKEKYGNLAGIAQQYLFYWRREA